MKPNLERSFDLITDRLAIGIMVSRNWKEFSLGINLRCSWYDYVLMGDYENGNGVTRSLTSLSVRLLWFHVAINLYV